MIGRQVHYLVTENVDINTKHYNKLLSFSEQKVLENTPKQPKLRQKTLDLRHNLMPNSSKLFTGACGSCWAFSFQEKSPENPLK